MGMTEREKIGVKCIRRLQMLKNIRESSTKALKGWRAMSEAQQEQTFLAAEALGVVARKEIEKIKKKQVDSAL